MTSLLDHVERIRDDRRCGKAGCCTGATVHCPVHEDASPSLSVDQGDNGRPIVHCFAGCDPQDVIAALRERDLWPSNDVAQTPLRREWPAYLASNGAQVSVHVREDRPDGKRTWWSPKLKVQGIGPRDLALYRIDVALAHPDRPIVVCEGEPATGALRAIEDAAGIVAVGTVTGASSIPCDDALLPLVGRDTYLARDNDSPGFMHMNGIAEALHRLGGESHPFDWPSVPEKGDAVEWIGAGNGPDDLVGLLDVAAKWIPEDAHEASGLVWHTGDEIAAATPAEVPYLVRPYFPLASVVDSTAKIKVGKTQLSLDLVRAVVSGGMFLGQRVERAGAVILLTEQGPNSFQDQLRRSGISSPKLSVLYRHEAGNLPWELVVLGALARANKVGAVLLVVDTLSGWAGFGAEGENDSGAATLAMRPIQDAAATGLTVLVNRHDRKSGGEIGEAGRGSGAIGGAADVLLHLVRATSEGHENRRTLEYTGRYEDAPAKVTVEWNGSEYVLLGNVTDVERNEARLLIPDILPMPDSDPMLRKDVITAVKGRAGSISKSTIERALTELAGSGEIEVVSGYGKNKQGLGYRLNESTVESLSNGTLNQSSNHVPGNDVPETDDSGVRRGDLTADSGSIPLVNQRIGQSARGEAL